jgi:DNA mismatch repair protein MutL
MSKFMSQIRILENEVINKIAAGEIIERPANILKELVENSLDAGSSNIIITIEEGGKKLIVVSDDGDGINKKDAHLSICRHATSKINQAEDLFEIKSMGFRGEALAAISSVSNFSLSSRHSSEKDGFKLIKKIDEQQTSIVPWKSEQGTIVCIENLFNNIPARLKFLKSPQNEFAHCYEYVQALALARPHHGFKLTHNKKERLQVRTSDPCVKTPKEFLFFGESLIKSRAEQILGNKFEADKHLYTKSQNDFASFEAIISPPGFEKATTKSIFIFVNGRWIKDKIIRYAIMRGYHSHIQKNCYPSMIAYIRIDPTLLDVNVHPAKTEVKFQYQSEIQELISQTIRSKLREADWATPFVPELKTSQKQNDSFILSNTPSPATEKTATQIFRQAPTTRFQPLKISNEIISKQKEDNNKKIDWNEAIYQGVFKKCYLIFEYFDQLLIVDQHAFHERILYEQLTKNKQLLQRVSKLLIPENIYLSSLQIQALKEKANLIKSLGFDFEIISNKELDLKSVPAILTRANMQKLFEDITKITSVAEIAHLELATIACHSAVRAGTILSEKERDLMLSQAQNIDFYHNCPHGRRVLAFFSNKQVEKWFDRT